MAYAALTSLKTTIELQFLLQPIPARVSFRDDQTPPIKYFYENLSSLQAFLEKKSSGSAAALKYFQTILRDFALKVEDEIKMEVSNFVLAKDDAVNQEAASQQLCQIFKQAEEKTADVVEIIKELKEKEYNKGDKGDYLTYLMGIIDHQIKSLQSDARVFRFYDQTQLKSLIKNLYSLRGFLHTSKHGGGAAAISNDLETKIRDLAVDDIKPFQELCQTLHQITENAAQLLSTTHNTRSNNEATDDDEANDTTQSVCYPKLEEGRILMVGRQNDVSMIKNRLLNGFHGVKVIPIIGMPGDGL